MLKSVTALTMVVTGCVTSNDGMGGGGSAGGGGGGGGGGGSMLPAELVGTWITTGGDAGISYQFTANGNVVYAGKLDTSNGCTFTVDTSYQGIVTLSGNVLQIQPTQGTQTYDDCGSVSTSDFTQSETDAYQVQGSVLSLQNQSTGVTLMLQRS